MMITIYVISIIVGLSSNIILWVFSLLFCFRSYNPPYLRFFPIYPTACLATEAIMMSFTGFRNFFSNNHTVTIIPYNFFTLFELLFFSYFFTKIIDSKKAKTLVLSMAAFFLILFILLVLKYGANNRGSGPMSLLESIILVIPCFIYFRELFKRPRTFDLTKEPSFWIVTATLFYFSIMIPVLLFIYYFGKCNMPNVCCGIYSFNNYSNIITNVLYIKGFTCRIKK